MPALQVRDFPEELYEKLKQRAAEEHRSVAQQTVCLVEQGLGGCEGLLSEGCSPHDGLHDEEKGDAARIFRFEDERSRKGRIDRRKALFARIDALAGSVNKDAGFFNLADAVSESRAERSERIAKAALSGLTEDSL